MKRMPRGHRSFVLVAVLVVITSAVLVATSMIFVAQGRAVETAGASDAAQMRALAWSGIQVVMREIADQRQQMLNGQLPELQRQYTIYETQTRAGIVRLLPMSADGQSLLSAEAGKLDLNIVTPGMLSLTGMIEPGAAEAIVTYRDQTLKRPYQSVAELLHVPGASITPAMLYGPIEELKPRDQAQQEQMDLAERVAARLQTDRVRGLADAVTVFAIEPAVQRDGSPRINLNQPWSEALGQHIAARFGDDAAQQVKSMMENGAKFETEGSLIKALIDAKFEPRVWPDLIDAFTTDAGEFHFGRLDINTAPLPALLSLPEITAAQASHIVSMRQQLSDDEKSSMAWPVISQIVPPEALIKLAGQITTRCFTYRVRIGAGEVHPDEPDGSMSNPVIIEAVIDLSSQKPRLAYLRDISVLQAAAQIALDASANESLVEESVESGTQSGAADTSPEQPVAATEPSPDASETSAAASAPPTSENNPESVPAASKRRVGRWLNGG